MLAKHQVACLLASFAAAIQMRASDSGSATTDFPDIYDNAEKWCPAKDDFEDCSDCIYSALAALDYKCGAKYPGSTQEGDDGDEGGENCLYGDKGKIDILILEGSCPAKEKDENAR